MSLCRTNLSTEILRSLGRGSWPATLVKFTLQRTAQHNKRPLIRCMFSSSLHTGTEKWVWMVRSTSYKVCQDRSGKSDENAAWYELAAGHSVVHDRAALSQRQHSPVIELSYGDSWQVKSVRWC